MWCTANHLPEQQYVPYYKDSSECQSEGGTCQIWIICLFENKFIRCLGEKENIFYATDKPKFIKSLEPST